MKVFFSNRKKNDDDCAFIPKETEGCIFFTDDAVFVRVLRIVLNNK